MGGSVELNVPGGFVWSASGLAEMEEQVEAFRAEMQPLADGKLAAWMGAEAARSVDRRSVSDLLGDSVGHEYGPGTTLTRVFVALTRRLKRIHDNCIKDALDWRLTVVVIPSDGEVLGVAISGQDALLDAWLGKPFVRAYPFWDSGPRPEDIPADDWSRRSERWHGTIKCRLSQSGSVFKVLNGIPPLDQELVASMVPSHGTRINQIAMMVAHHRLVEEWQRDQKLRGGTEPFMAASPRLWASLHEPEGMRVWEDCEVEVAERLKPVLTGADLNY